MTVKSLWRSAEALWTHWAADMRPAALSLQKVPVSTRSSKKLQEGSSFWAQLLTLFSPRQIPQSTGNPLGQVLPIFLPLELHSYPHRTLEEVTLELQPNFPMLVGSQKRKLFSFWTAGYKRGLPVPSSGCLGPKDCSRFQESSLKGYPIVIV